jgi:hypothetical protein
VGRVAAAGLLALTVSALVLLAWGHGGGAAPARTRGPVAVLEPANGLAAIAGGWGDAWMDDRAGSRLLRVDGSSGRVLARIPVEGRLALSAGARAVWALQSGGGYGRGLRGPLLRIDPGSDQVTARIPLQALPGAAVLGFGVLVEGASVWVWGPSDILMVEPRTNRVARAIAVGYERGELTGLAVVDGRPLATTADGHLVRFDARSGAELSAIALPLTDPALRIAHGRRAVVTAGGTLAAVDAYTGRLDWRRRLGFRVSAVLEAGNALWALAATTEDAGDRLWTLDPRSGGVINSVVLPEFGTVGMASVDGALWVTTAAGRALVLSSWLGRWLRLGVGYPAAR